MPDLELRDASYAADGKRLLGPMSGTIPIMGTTLLLGPNGAGKSLFLAACHGMLPGVTGQITWDGQPADKSRATRGFVPQKPALLRRSVAANLDFALRALCPDQGAAERRAAIAQTLHLARLEDHAQTPAAALSGGETRRMAVARAMVAAPGVLLMDEPFAGLDPASASALEAFMAQIRKAGTDILLVSHNLARAQRLADSVIFMDKGQIVYHGAADAFFAASQPTVIVDFLEGRLS